MVQASLETSSIGRRNEIFEELIPRRSREFEAEIRTLERMRDPSLVRLLGHASLEDERCLVYELCDGGTLEDALGSPRPPDWDRRLKIARDAIKGLYYLHTQGDGTAFIHGDVKSANILLDGPRAKLADFGLVREMDAKKTHVGTRSLSGSWGYICPHYARTGQCSPATDLYAFGVVLLEALTGAGAISNAREPKDLVSWCEAGAWARRDARIRIADGTGRGVAGVASDCLNANARARPPTESVHDAIEELELAQSRETFRGRPASGRSLFGDGFRPRPESSSAFAVVVGSFNMNGEGLDVATLAAWLRHGTVVDGRGRRRAADLVVVGLQEAAKGRAFQCLNQSLV